MTGLSLQGAEIAGGGRVSEVTLQYKSRAEGFELHRTDPVTGVVHVCPALYSEATGFLFPAVQMVRPNGYVSNFVL